MGGSTSKAASTPPTSAPSSANIVRLNVYSPSGGQHAIYHSGVEVFGAEYVFGGGDTSYSGVTAQRPRIPPPESGWTFYQSVDIGPLRFSREDALRAIQDISREFPARSYDLVSRNCNHFADALCKRLCGDDKGIPSWVNRLAGIGNSIRNVVGSAPASQGQTQAVADGVGGPSAIGLAARTTASDGDLSGEVDWAKVGVLNAAEADPAESLRSLKQSVSSDPGGSAELLLQIPFLSPVKLQKIRLEVAKRGNAPTRMRLFANLPNLDMDDASGGHPATQEVDALVWSGVEGKSDEVAVTFEVNFLKFQKLSFLSVYVGRSDEDENDAIAISSIRLTGRV